MSVMAHLFGKCPRQASRRRISSVRTPSPGLEPLEGRALMALLSSVAFDPKGQEVADIIVNDPGSFTGLYDKVYTPGYVANGPTPFLANNNNLYAQVSNFRSVSTAYSKSGNILQDVVDNSGTATQYISYINGTYSQIILGPGVESMSVAFNPDGSAVSDVVYEDGSYYEFTSAGGSTLVASNVVSASVAIDKARDKLQDYVTADGILHEISGSGTATLGTNVVSSGVAFDGNGGIVRAVVFTDGNAYQYDYAGAHHSGQLFTPALQSVIGSTSIAFKPTTGEEYALITFSDTTLYQYNISGAARLAFFGGNLTASTAFSKDGKIIQDYVAIDGTAYESINGSQGAFLGRNVQSISIAFDPQGNEVADVVYWNGEYYEFTASGGSNLIASNVVSASVAIDSNGDKLQDYVTADGMLHEISGSTTTTLGTNVVSASVAYDGNGGTARSVLFTNGLAYQYDYAGQHLQGQVFNPFLINPNRLALKAKLPSFTI